MSVSVTGFVASAAQRMAGCHAHRHYPTAPPIEPIAPNGIECPTFGAPTAPIGDPIRADCSPELRLPRRALERREDEMLLLVLVWDAKLAEKNVK
ncbi:hypothetical protein F66182_4846 [Fusarium sp. NRRL 66182]|nr:hypothetical protein F66182_4846 [Fusarium sp. NRRL 66182]